eukprot:1176124-Prorocentrum_minimum.AAC.2
MPESAARLKTLKRPPPSHCGHWHFGCFASLIGRTIPSRPARGLHNSSVPGVPGMRRVGPPSIIYRG